MLLNWVIMLVSFTYLGILFAIAYYGDRRADCGRSIISNPYVYTLSIAIYCTAWTFYGSVGYAATTGVTFLPMYTGVTLMAALWWLVLRKIIHIAKIQRITSIADFIGCRYGKSRLLSGLVTIIAVIGIMPYISLQLKAISTSFEIVHYYPAVTTMTLANTYSLWTDTALYITLLLILFTIIFGTRHIDVTEKHEGLVAAVAFESVVKLVAFLSVGIFVTFSLFDGFGDLFTQVSAVTELQPLLTMKPGLYANWLSLTFLAMMAIMFLPRQFQILVVENVDEKHVKTASWLFPLYLLVINVFMLPIALGGRLLLPQMNPDAYVLTLPLSAHAETLAILVFVGGLSAATSMVIVETVVLATMVCNDLVLSILLQIKPLRLQERRNLNRLLLIIRRSTIVIILLLSYGYFRLVGESYTLVTIGLMSFAAAAQFAPAILLGIYWKKASRNGALAGLMAGFSLWLYTLLLPSLAKSGWLPISFVEMGLWNISLLKPEALFGLTGLDSLTHSLFWSLLINVTCLVGFSLFSRQSVVEQLQSTLFVDTFRDDTNKRGEAFYWGASVSTEELQSLLIRFLGESHARQTFEHYACSRNLDLGKQVVSDPHCIEFAERLLAGAIGTASAHVMITSTIKGKTLSIEAVMRILDETSEVVEYSRRLEQKSQELEEATTQLAKANLAITQLNDRLKAENLRMSTELDVARRLQRVLLPKEPELRQMAEIDIAGFLEPAEEMGGDYYDVLRHEDRIKIGIGDVTGHGLESGVVTIMVQTAVRTLLANGVTDPVIFLNVLNRAIYDNIQRMNCDRSLTLALIDYQAGKLHLSGQHEEVLLVRQNGCVERIDTLDLGFPVGLEEDIHGFINSREAYLQPGDGIVLYTDGITEAENLQKVQYGIDRLCATISQHWQQSAQVIQDAVIADVRRHIGEQKVFDDMTLIVLKQK